MSHFYERLGLAVQLPQRGWPMHGVLLVAPENHEIVIYYSNSKLPVLEQEQTAQPPPHATLCLVAVYGGS